MDEFLGDYKDADDAEADEPEWVTEERKKFKEAYDKDNDGKLNKEEVSVFFFMFLLVKYSRVNRIFHNSYSNVVLRALGLFG